MNHIDVNKLHYGSAEVPLQRKRGRPRKHPKPDVGGNRDIPKSENLKWSLNLERHPQVTLGFDTASVNHPLQRESVDNAKNSMIGQGVSGVVEAVFDAGFLLSVKVGNSDMILRGVVFKPGCYVPVSVENDIAPNVEMIRRNEVSFPTQLISNINRMETHPVNGFAAVNPMSGVAGSSRKVMAAIGKQLS